MTDFPPALFRALEKQGVPLRFDDIIRAAVAGADRSGAGGQLRREVIELVDAAWDRLEERTREEIAPLLSRQSRLNARLAERVGAIASPSAAPVPSGDTNPSPASGEIGIRHSAARVRDELRELVARGGRRVSAASKAPSLSTPEDLVAAARQGRSSQIVEALVRWTGCEASSLEPAADPQGLVLARACHATGLPIIDTMTICMFLRPQIGTDLERFLALRRECESWPPVARPVKPSRSDTARKSPAEPIFTRDEATSRRAFGRRTEPPRPGEKLSKIG